MTQTPQILETTALGAVIELWRATGRTIEVCFGGQSMQPTIAAGQPVRVVCDTLFEPGDVILFRFRGKLILHRVIEILPSGPIWTLGDANAIPDFPVDAQAVVGRVTAVSREGQWLDLPRVAPRPNAATLLVRPLLLRLPRLGSIVISVLWATRWPVAIVRAALTRLKTAAG